MLSTNESAEMAGTPSTLIMGIAAMIQIKAGIPKRWHRVESALIKPKTKRSDTTIF
jgi:hypothetical protein